MPGEKVSAAMFCEQFLAYAVHIDWCYHSIHKHSSGSQHAPLRWHWGMHRRPFEGRHLVLKLFSLNFLWETIWRKLFQQINQENCFQTNYFQENDSLICFLQTNCRLTNCLQTNSRQTIPPPPHAHLHSICSLSLSLSESMTLHVCLCVPLPALSAVHWIASQWPAVQCTVYALPKDYYITGRANPISCAVGLR